MKDETKGSWMAALVIIAGIIIMTLLYFNT